MSLKRKELEVLKLINSGKTVDEILFQMKTSERNLRYIIDNLNFYLKKILKNEIEKDKKRLLINLNENEIKYFYKEIYKNYYTLEQEERAEFILMTFLFVKDVRLSFIEKKLEITRATLKKDIEFLNGILKKYSLKLESEKNRFSIVGNEKKLRHLKALKYLEYIDLEITFLDKEYIFQNIEVDTLKSLRKIILEIEKKSSVEFKDDFIKLMEIFLYVSLERVKENHIIDRKINYKFLVNTPHYEIVKNSLRDYFNKELSYELVHITEYFISGGVTENIGELKESIEKYLDGLMITLKKILKQYLDYKELSSKLMGYLIPAIYRLKNNFSIKESGEKDEIFNLVLNYSKEEKYLPEKLTENEIMYISKEVKASIDREKNKVISLKTILDIVEKNSEKVDKERLIKELLKVYGKVIKKDL
ncbi:helix-turn-helix domain-containing protein [Cetobacterium somerae]|uniref:helix-turn-helix domain-containing protein n=1 Tax=Cetobacterium sp. NK01 TaxID=2993530 RepID=UPI002116C76D|nr:helix-turn-helix domain-containing protein [Cetobacterium sp. NK01]MCQ8213224.1 helix-turn-helix domain-containing protein [Cetobacterium sp. NK01]